MLVYGETMRRRAPRDGYGTGDDGSKRQYRRTVYSIFRHKIKPLCAEAHVLCMPSAEGAEVEVALANGFRETRLHLVDDNPAIVAHYLAPRFPRSHRYGVKAWRAVDRIASSGIRLTAANFDFTSNLHNGLATELYLISATQAAFADQSYVGITIQKGRESGDWWTGIKDWSPDRVDAVMRSHGIEGSMRSMLPGLDDLALSRIADVTWLLELAGYAAFRCLRAGQYRSAKVPMLWMVYERIAWSAVPADFIAYAKSKGGKIPTEADRRLADAALEGARTTGFRLVLEGDRLQFMTRPLVNGRPEWVNLLRLADLMKQDVEQRKEISAAHERAKQATG